MFREPVIGYDSVLGQSAAAISVPSLGMTLATTR
jgi:hypothetical protein